MEDQAPHYNATRVVVGSEFDPLIGQTEAPRFFSRGISRVFPIDGLGHFVRARDTSGCGRTRFKTA
jgi:hypothetical protein